MPTWLEAITYHVGMDTTSKGKGHGVSRVTELQLGSIAICDCSNGIYIFHGYQVSVLNTQKDVVDKPEA